MGIRQNTWDLSGHYDLTNSGLNSYIGDSLLFAFGYNNNGQLGLNNKTYYSSPRQIPGTQWSSASPPPEVSQAGAGVKTDGTLWAWGYNNNGQLGLNNTALYSSPTQIPGTQWSKVLIAASGSFATKNDGTLWSWGYNNNGQGGSNDVVRRSSPVQIPGTQWSYVSGGKRGGGYGVIGLKTDGTLWTWGGGGLGNLGQNDRVDRSSPTQIPGTQWNSASHGGYNVVATKNDGTLWIWGYNASGELGQNDLIYRSSPTQVPGTQWSLVTSCGPYGKHCIKTDGTLWVWGLGNYGMLGLNNGGTGATTTPYSSPTQVPGTSWSKIMSGSYGSMATKTDGTLWTWGRNPYGELGLNNTTYRSSPTQIPGTEWKNTLFDGYDSALMLLKTQ